jgi:hypothetical protein
MPITNLLYTDKKVNLKFTNGIINNEINKTDKNNNKFTPSALIS